MKLLLLSTAAILAALSAAPISAAVDSLDAMLAPIIAEKQLPAMAAAVVKNGRIVAVGVAGTRKLGSNIPVTVADKWHLGSDTKGMTAVLLARQVEKGKLRWDSTVGEVFPELKDSLDPGFAAATLIQLLSHTSGLPSDGKPFIDLLLAAMANTSGNMDAARYYMVREGGKAPLDHEPNVKFVYSNFGYVVAGAMLEKVTGRTWDELIQEEIFAPLGQSSAGLGTPATYGKVDQPLGHDQVDGKLFAHLAGPDSDNPIIIGPAGVAHMSISDFAVWAGWNAGEGKRGPALVSAETLKKLHTPVIQLEVPNAAPGTPATGGYGMGFGTKSFAWTKRPVLIHSGSNGRSLSNLYIDTTADLAIVTASNISTPAAQQASDQVAEILYKKYVDTNTGK